MRRLPILIAALVSLPLLVGGCSNIRETLGLSKQSPDEFKVVSRAPLSMPPDYNLKPPTPGAPRPHVARGLGAHLTASEPGPRAAQETS